MDNNLMPNMEAAYYAVTGNAGRPRFSLTESEARQILAACEDAKMQGPIMEKVKTMYNFAAVKARYSAKETRVTMD